MNILAFFAHPDDETMLAGGTLALLARAGAQVHVLCATRGEGGEVGEPPVCLIEELGQVREAELVCAVQALGGRSLTFLDYVDPRMGPDEALFAYSADLTRLAGQVAAAIRQFEIEAVLSHGSNGEYGHPAHVLSYQAARLAVESFEKMDSGQTPMLYTVAASFPDHPRPRLSNPDDSAHLVLDIRPALEQKTAAALCHRSQQALFVRRQSEEAGRRLSVPEVIIPLEGLRRAYPPSDGLPEDKLANLLRPWSLDGRAGLRE
jgi:LmbE family N-acetylglucosaminyl deacetylase